MRSDHLVFVSFVQKKKKRHRQCKPLFLSFLYNLKPHVFFSFFLHYGSVFLFFFFTFPFFSPVSSGVACVKQRIFFFHILKIKKKKLSVLECLVEVAKVKIRTLPLVNSRNVRVRLCVLWLCIASFFFSFETHPAHDFFFFCLCVNLVLCAPHATSRAICTFFFFFLLSSCFVGGDDLPIALELCQLRCSNNPIRKICEAALMHSSSKMNGVP